MAHSLCKESEATDGNYSSHDVCYRHRSISSDEINQNCIMFCVDFKQLHRLCDKKTSTWNVFSLCPPCCACDSCQHFNVVTVVSVGESDVVCRGGRRVHRCDHVVAGP